jgi:hypothetical protein
MEDPMGGPWKVRGFDPRAWQRPVPRVEPMGTAPVAYEAAIALAWLATVVAGAGVLMVLAGGW